MIASLTGQVARIDLDSLVLEVGGIGYLVRTTPQALMATRHGAELTLHTELVVREDSMTLYGFPHADEAETFRIVQSVSGIGPRTALAVLGCSSPRSCGARSRNRMRRPSPAPRHRTEGRQPHAARAQRQAACTHDRHGRGRRPRSCRPQRRSGR
nr:Holliday junction branch migration protein RuvA [Brachybacterium sp. Z12]